MTPTELALVPFVAQEIPLSEGELQTGFAFGIRARARPVAAGGVEIAYTQGPRGGDFALGGLAFFGEPQEELVLTAFGGFGVRFVPEPELFATAALGTDVVLFDWLDLRGDVRLTVDGEHGFGLLLSVGPQFHTVRSFDADGDGVSDRLDRCRLESEDLDGYEDADGCADLDDDRDGVEDAVDACPRVAEDRDRFLDGDGCPEPDNDGDERIDDRDACINEPEDLDGYRDADGCPDPDNDADAVPDTADTCPNVAEDRDQFEDADGCPDPDNDLDGVGDIFDLAPNESENLNFFEDDDGRPEVLPPLLQRVLGSQPRFRFTWNELTEAGLERAELVAAALLQWPTLRMEVRVSDPVLATAEARALSIVAAVTQQGVMADRLEPAATEGPAEVMIRLLPPE